MLRRCGRRYCAATFFTGLPSFRSSALQIRTDDRHTFGGRIDGCWIPDTPAASLAASHVRARVVDPALMLVSLERGARMALQCVKAEQLRIARFLSPQLCHRGL